MVAEDAADIEEGSGQAGKRGETVGETVGRHHWVRLWAQVHPRKAQGNLPLVLVCSC